MKKDLFFELMPLFLFEKRDLTFKKFLDERRGGMDPEEEPEQSQEAGAGAGGAEHWHHLYFS